MDTTTSVAPATTVQEKTATFIEANRPQLIWGVIILAVIIILFMLKSALTKSGK